MNVTGTPLTIIGIALPGFNGVALGNVPEVCVPISLRPVLSPGWDGAERYDSNGIYLGARLRGTRPPHPGGWPAAFPARWPSPETPATNSTTTNVEACAKYFYKCRNRDAMKLSEAVMPIPVRNPLGNLSFKEGTFRGPFLGTIKTRTWSARPTLFC
jgi:hypothetical protein